MPQAADKNIYIKEHTRSYHAGCINGILKQKNTSSKKTKRPQFLVSDPLLKY